MPSPRRDYLEALVPLVDDDIVVSYLGDSSRIWSILKPDGANIFLRDGMSLAIPVAVGVALSMPEQHVIVMEGDGSLLMHVGSLATVAKLSLSNLTILLFNNEIYESSGGQALPAEHVDYEGLARAAGLIDCATFDTVEGFSARLRDGLPRGTTSFFCLKTALQADYEPVSPPLNPLEVKHKFLHWVEAKRQQETRD